MTPNDFDHRQPDDIRMTQRANNVNNAPSQSSHILLLLGFGLRSPPHLGGKPLR
jgi:hypothetical protein